jgi:hypothetical protein
MRMTIVKSDTFVAIDGLGFNGIDMSNLSSDFHALQWYETFGNLELIDPVTRVMRNETVDNLAPYDPQISGWNAKKAEHDAAQVANND